MYQVTAILSNGDIETVTAVDVFDAGQKQATFYMEGAELVSISRDSEIVSQVKGY